MQKNLVTTPKTCSFNILVKEVACGFDHTHLVSKDGYLYSMGSNEHGKLGLGISYKELIQSASPRLVESIKGVRSVAAGLHHSMAVGRDPNNKSKVYGWGQAEYGQIGMRLVSSNQPVEVRVDGKIVRVACGSNHSAFLSGKRVLC